MTLSATEQIRTQCCDLVRKHAAFCILATTTPRAGRMDYSYYYDAARQALDLHASTLTYDNMGWLKGLPYERREGHISYCHGSPINPRSSSTSSDRAGGAVPPLLGSAGRCHVYRPLAPVQGLRPVPQMKSMRSWRKSSRSAPATAT